MRLLAVAALWIVAQGTFGHDTNEDEQGLEALVQCSDDEVWIRCRSYHQMAAVREAWFYETGHVCREAPPPPPPGPPASVTAVPRHSLLSSVNARCSGRRHCRFLLRDHHPNVWRPGVVYIRYRCIPRKTVTRFCSEVVTSPHGYLANPGYPRYYPGNQNCSWHVRAEPGQRVRVRVHDLSVRGIEQGAETCTDFLRVTEGRRVLTLTCGDLSEVIEVTSRGPEVTVTLWSEGQTLYPHRGTLVQHTALGCPTPAPPKDGYRVYRNATHAYFSCCVNHVFGDTLKKDRLLRCRDGRGWSQPLPEQCIDVRILLEFGNATVRRILEQELVTARPELRPVLTERADMFVDTILPIIIMIVLIGGNCVIVGVIWKLRQRARAADSSAERPMVSLIPLHAYSSQATSAAAAGFGGGGGEGVRFPRQRGGGPQ